MRCVFRRVLILAVGMLLLFPVQSVCARAVYACGTAPKSDIVPALYSRLRGQADLAEAEARAALPAFLREGSLFAWVAGRDPLAVGGNCLLAVGSLDGLADGMGAVSVEGCLVGRVQSVLPRTAALQSLADPDSAVSVRISPGGMVGILRGDGTGMTVTGLPADALPQTGDIVVTSGLGGLPAGLLIGTVARAGRAIGATSCTAEVTPAADCAAVTRVFILSDSLSEVKI